VTVSLEGTRTYTITGCVLRLLVSSSAAVPAALSPLDTYRHISASLKRLQEVSEAVLGRIEEAVSVPLYLCVPLYFCVPLYLCKFVNLFEVSDTWAGHQADFLAGFGPEALSASLHLHLLAIWDATTPSYQPSINFCRQTLEPLWPFRPPSVPHVPFDLELAAHPAPPHELATCLSLSRSRMLHLNWKFEALHAAQHAPVCGFRSKRRHACRSPVRPDRGCQRELIRRLALR